MQNVEHSCDQVPSRTSNIAVIEYIPERWTQLWSSTFQNGIFEKIAITVTKVVLIQMFFRTVEPKQKK